MKSNLFKAQQRFEKGTITQKRYLMRVFGSNLVLKDKILEVEPRGPFQLITKALAVPEARLEPDKELDILGLNEDLYPQNFVWGDRRELNPQRSAPQADALPLSYGHHYLYFIIF